MNSLLFAHFWIFLSSISAGSGLVYGRPRIFSRIFPEIYKPSLAKTILDAAKRRCEKKGWDFPFDSAEDNLVKKPNANTSAFRKIRAFSSNQIAYLGLMREETVDIVVAIGPAGTGKTLLACHSAVEALRIGKTQKIVITRPVVSVDEEIGYLPGGMESKMDPWTRPVFDALRESYSQKEIDSMMENGVIEIAPLGFMRGRTFKNAWIIADEMQNSTPTQMLMLATRIGEGSKMVITGDLAQSDLAGPNGLHEIRDKIIRRKTDYIRLIELEGVDVQRSRAAKAVLGIYGGFVSESTPSTTTQDQDTTATDATATDATATDPLDIPAPVAQDPVQDVPVPSDCEFDFEPSTDIPTAMSSPTNEISARGWIQLENDAALIPAHHQSKYTNRY